MRTGYRNAVVLALALGVAGGPAALRADETAPSPPPARLASSPAIADLVLVGIVQREDGRSLAIIEDVRAKRQGLYRAGATVRGARIEKIESDRVVFAVPGGDVELRLAGGARGRVPEPPPAPGLPPVVFAPPEPVSGPPAPPPDPRFRRLERTTLDRLVETPELVMGVVPMPDRGVRIASVRSSGFFEALGLRKGDVILTVNGREPGASVPLATIVRQAANDGTLRLEIARDGRHDVQYFQIEP